MRERVVEGKVPDAVESVVGPLPDCGKQRARAGAPTVAVEIPAELEGVRSFVPRGDIAPLLVVLDEHSVREALAVTFDSRHVDPRNLASADGSVAFGMLPRPSGLVDQVGRNDPRPVQIRECSPLLLHVRERGIHRGIAEQHLLVGRAGDAAINAVLALVEVMVDPERPLHAVAGQGLRKGSALGDREVAGERTDRCGDPLRAAAIGAEQAARRLSDALFLQNVRELVHDHGPNVVRMPFADQVGELSAHDGPAEPSPDAGSEDVH